ncbi:hypothetical protein QFZ33_003227 [Arthrobacter globiformis]|nr:hypothetical protein [Arthrobacter globiformis]
MPGCLIPFFSVFALASFWFIGIFPSANRNCPRHTGRTEEIIAYPEPPDLPAEKIRELID